MKRIWLFLMMVCVMGFFEPAGAEELWWKKWQAHPKDMPRITAKEVKALMMSGEKILFVYAGYKIDSVVCGSVVVPYTLVPPFGDGSRAKLKIPKDVWIMCY